MNIDVKVILRHVMKYICLVTDECANLDDIERMYDMIVECLIIACSNRKISETEYKGYLRMVEYVTELAKINLGWIKNGTN